MIDSNAGLSEAKRALLQQRIRGRGAVRDTQTQLVAREQAGPAPLAAIQEHLWHSSRLAPENPVYNEVIVIHKDGPFDAGAWRAAFTELIRRHHIWRSSYSVVDGEPLQIIHPAAPVDLPVLDLSWTARGEAELEAGRLAAEQARRPFDMANGPLLRTLLVRIAADHHRRGAWALVARYACPPNDVAMDLFVTAERTAGAGSDSLGWAELHEGVLRVHRFEGDHRAMVTEPQVTLVAETVSRSLRDAVCASQAS
jgi:Condensation domain